MYLYVLLTFSLNVGPTCVVMCKFLVLYCSALLIVFLSSSQKALFSQFMQMMTGGYCPGIYQG
jgi:hypothetical protein